MQPRYGFTVYFRQALAYVRMCITRIARISPSLVRRGRRYAEGAKPRASLARAYRSDMTMITIRRYKLSKRHGAASKRAVVYAANSKRAMMYAAKRGGKEG